MTYHCGITSPGKRWEPSYLALFKVRLDRTSEKNSVRNTPAQVGGWSKWLNTIGLSSFNRCNSLMHQTLPAGIARKKDPGVLSIKKLIDTFRSSRRHCKEQRRSVVRRGVQRYPPVSLLLGSLLFGEQRRNGSWQTGQRRAPCRRHWEDWAGIALPGGGKHVVEEGDGEGRVLAAGQRLLFTFEKLV